MAVIDLQRNHVGIQTFETKFGENLMAGRGSFLQHTDGYMYCVFARNITDYPFERLLFYTRSNDDGVTWSDAVQLTLSGVGNWDDEPSIAQLDPTDIDSEIAVVYRNGYYDDGPQNTYDYIRRFTFNKETGEATSPFDAISTGSGADGLFLSLVKFYWGWKVFALNATFNNARSIIVYTTTQFFTDNAWTQSSLSNEFPISSEALGMSIKTLSNGHLMMVITYRTALNGLAAIGGISNLPSGILRCDVGVKFSDDEGETWTAIQKLTNYTGTTNLDLVGTDSVASADFTQLSDDKIAVGYQEHTAPQVINVNTALAMTASGYSKVAYYHTAKNALFLAGGGALDGNETNAGVFYVDLTNQTVLRLCTTSSPALWKNGVNFLDVSPDGNYLAIGLRTGGIHIIDISASDPDDWVSVKELRTTSSPAVLSDSIHMIRWVNNDQVAFTYVTQQTYCGGIYKISTDTITAINISGGNTNQSFVTQNNHIIIITNSYIRKIDPDTGSILYYLNTTFIQLTDIYYDSILNYYIVSRYDTTIWIEDTGSAFNQLLYYDSTTTPKIIRNYGIGYINGRGIVFAAGMTALHAGYRLAWLSNFNSSFQGCRTWVNDLHLGENFDTGMNLQFARDIKPGWLCLGSSSQYIFLNLYKTGRLRYGVFTYDAVNKTLITSGVDFYDVCNEIKLSTDVINRLQFPAMGRDADDRIYFYISKFNVYSDGNEFAALIGTVDPDVKKTTMMARILSNYTAPMQSRTRVRNTYTVNLDARMRIVFAQCIKAKARIVPVNVVTMTSKAAIQNWKSNIVVGSFNVQQTGRTATIRLQFWSNTGYNSFQSLQAKARIVKTSTCRVTGHFIIPAVGLGNLINFSGVSKSKQILSLRACISK
jgi:hypothetical protein